MGLDKIISGGQTGADRAALNWAIGRGIPHGGKCPKGRKAEDGPIPSRYKMTELNPASYLARTRANVAESDGTVIFTIATKLRGGSLRTAECAKKAGKPWLHLSEERDGSKAAVMLKRFLSAHQIHLLNVAGSRKSEEPGAARFVRRVLKGALS